MVEGRSEPWLDARILQLHQPHIQLVKMLSLNAAGRPLYRQAHSAWPLPPNRILPHSGLTQYLLHAGIHIKHQAICHEYLTWYIKDTARVPEEGGTQAEASVQDGKTLTWVSPQEAKDSPVFYYKVKIYRRKHTSILKSKESFFPFFLFSLCKLLSNEHSSIH